MPRSSDTLQPYRAKRNFGRTTEPSGVAARGKPAGELSYVVQRHQARRLHYDFRLEIDGTMKSWAVPKGPSLDPSVKRMAVHVEDHPIAYNDFEGTIPKGQYGAGKVIIWDRGSWQADGDIAAAYRAGKLKFDLSGVKPQGRWALVRTHGKAQDSQDAWLLIKEKDRHARPQEEYDVTEALPYSVSTQTGGKATLPSGKTSSQTRKTDRKSTRLNSSHVKIS